MALSWPSVMESRPTCWRVQGSTSCVLEKNDGTGGSTMLTAAEKAEVYGFPAVLNASLQALE